MLTFGNLLLMAGAALVGVPILIHLLNRMRYKIVHWAAMEFLLQAYREERRRVQLEHWILLAMRCLIVLALVFAVADPAIRYSGLGAVGSQPTERILLLDDTYSMGQAVRGETAFTLARVEIERLLESLSDSRSRDTVTLVLASAPEKPLFDSMALSQENLGKFKDALRGLEPSDQATATRDVLARFHQAIVGRREGAQRVVYFFSDYRAHDWRPEDWKAVADPASVPGLDRDTQWVLVDVGEPDPANLSIVGVETRPREAVAGIEFELAVRVANRGDRPVRNVAVSVRIGDEIQREKEIEAIPAGQVGEAVLGLRLTTPGEYPITASIEPDPLAADDVQYGQVQVLPDHAILLVDRDPPGYQMMRETYFLARALAPKGLQRSGLATRVVGDDEFRDVKDFDEFSVVFLCNLPPISTQRVHDLEGYVQRGGAVVFYLGDQVDPADYNREYWKDGEGLLPYPIEPARDLFDAAGGEGMPAHFDPDPKAHPLMAPFAGATRLLQEVEVSRAFGVTVTEEAPAGSNVVLRCTDPQRTVAIAEKTVGRGRTYLITTTADLGTMSMNDKGWNDWLKGAGYLVFNQLLVHHVLSMRPVDPARRPGSPIRFPIDISRFDRRVRFTPHAELESPSSYEEPARESKSGEAQGLWVEFDKTQEVGLYRFDLTPKTGGDPAPRFVAITLDPADGQLVKAGQARVKDVIGEAGIAAGVEPGEVHYHELYHEAGAPNWLAFLEEKTRIWQWVVVAVLALLFSESFYAWWIGNR